MFRLYFVFLLFISSLCASSYTYVLSSNKSLDSAKSFVNRHLKNTKGDIFIIKHKDRYRVSYGSFKSRDESVGVKQKLSKEVNTKPYLLKIDFDLYNSSDVVWRSGNKSSKTHSKSRSKKEYKDYNYALVFVSTKSRDNAYRFKEESLKKYGDKIEVVGYKDMHRVIYNGFYTKDEANSFKNSLPKKFKPFLIKLNKEQKRSYKKKIPLEKEEPSFKEQKKLPKINELKQVKEVLYSREIKEIH